MVAKYVYCSNVCMYNILCHIKDLRLKTAELVDLLSDKDANATVAKEDLAEHGRRHRELRQWVSLRVAGFIDETA